MQFAVTLLICQLRNLFPLRRGKKRLKEESSILSGFHFSDFLSFLGHVSSLDFCLIIEVCILKFLCLPGHSFSFINSRSHVLSTIVIVLMITNTPPLEQGKQKYICAILSFL